MTVIRVLPEPYYSQVMHSNDHIEPGSIFDAIAKSTAGRMNGDCQFQPKLMQSSFQGSFDRMLFRISLF